MLENREIALERSYIGYTVYRSTDEKATFILFFLLRRRLGGKLKRHSTHQSSRRPDGVVFERDKIRIVMLILLGKWKYPLESSLLLGNHVGINALIYRYIFLDNLHSHVRWTAAAAFIHTYIFRACSIYIVLSLAFLLSYYIKINIPVHLDK